MTTTFEQILEDMKNDQEKLLQPKTLSWYLDQIKELSKPQTLTSDPTTEKTQKAADTAQKQNMTPGDARNMVIKENVLELNSTFNPSMIGKMIFFAYDPKGRDKLPYYDMFPLIFPFKIDHGSTLGMNLHYLPPLERAKLMTALYSLINTKEMSLNSKLLLSYKILNNSARFRFFKPCIKRYLHSHIYSQVMVINPQNWNQVLMMPIARFQKASDYKVWQDSIMIAKKSSAL